MFLFNTHTIRLGFLSSLLLLLQMMIIFQACNEEEVINNTEITEKPLKLPLSQVTLFEMEGHHIDNAPELDENEVICTFQTLEDIVGEKEYSIRARIVKRRKTTELVLDAPLHIGKQYFMYISYRGPRDPNTVLRTFGLNLKLNVTENDVEVELPDNHYKENGIKGAGTQENPYLISNANDLLLMENLINGDPLGEHYGGAHFSQISDIDMTFVCDYQNIEYGWLPIGYTNTSPFRGYYHGNNHTISNLRIKRTDSYAGGLFGCLYGAKIEDLVIKKADIEMQAAAGAIAGAVVVGGGDNQPNGKQVSSQINNCRVEQSHVKTSFYGGLLVGMADTYAHLLIDSCSVSSSNSINAEYGAGGMVGVGIYQSYVALQNVSNNSAAVKSKIGAAGGLIGTSDTLLVVNAYNSGAIEVTGDNEERYAAGGIAGGTGCGHFLNCVNKGTVKGDRGVGGILGSALLDKGDGTEENPGMYNNAMFTTCINDATITANSYAGGICGEAQVAAISCGNFGDVTVAEGYAAGIVANSPAVTLVDCMNKGQIHAKRMSGGLNGMAIFGTSTFCNNYGEVKSTNGNSGGIIALGGGGMMIHYCGNYGSISGGSKGEVGGIVGELGKVREWSPSDYASVIMGSIGIITSAASIVTSSIFTSRQISLKNAKILDLKGIVALQVLEKKIPVADWHFRGFAIAQGVVNTILTTFDLDALINPHSQTTEAKRTAMESAFQQRSTALCDSLSMVRKQMNNIVCSVVSGVDAKQMLNDQIAAFEAERNAVMADEKKCTSLNEEIDARRAVIKGEAEEEKRIRDTALDIANGVLAAISMILFATTVSLLSGGVALPLALGIVSSSVVIISSSNTMAKSIMNYQINATEITQCYNYGTVKGGKNCGGIVGKSNDYGRLYECYNVGTIHKASSHTGYIAGEIGNQTVLAVTYNISNGGDASAIIGHHAENPQRIANNYVITSPADMSSNENYESFDFNSIWKEPAVSSSDETLYRLPIINQSEYANSSYTN